MRITAQMDLEQYGRVNHLTNQHIQLPPDLERDRQFVQELLALDKPESPVILATLAQLAAEQFGTSIFVLPQAIYDLFDYESPQENEPYEQTNLAKWINAITAWIMIQDEASYRQTDESNGTLTAPDTR